MRVTEAIRTALPYLHNKEVRDRLTVLLSCHDSDLEEVGYVTSTGTMGAIRELETAMNEFDETVAARRAAVKEIRREAEAEEA